VLAYPRQGETFADLADEFGVGRTTAWRYVNETVELLAARAPKLRAAVRGAKRAGHAYVILDGTLIPIDRVARAASAVATRTAEHAAVDDARRVAELLSVLGKAGEDQAVSVLAARAADAGQWQLSLEVCPGMGQRSKFGRQPDGIAAMPWGWQDLDN